MNKPYRFPKDARLRKREEFLTVKNRGRLIRTRSFIIYVSSTSPHGRSRLGVTVSKKVGGAVQRNRLKRLLREAFRLLQGEFDQKSDYSIIAKKHACHLSLANIAQEIKVLLTGQNKAPKEPCKPSC